VHISINFYILRQIAERKGGKIQGQRVRAGPFEDLTTTTDEVREGSFTTTAKGQDPMKGQKAEKTSRSVFYGGLISPSTTIKRAQRKKPMGGEIDGWGGVGETLCGDGRRALGEL